MTTHKLTKLKVKLLEAEIPQYQIAAKCGIHPSVLSKYALGQQVIAGDHLRKLCRYFKCRQDDLLGWVTLNYEDEELEDA